MNIFKKFPLPTASANFNFKIQLRLESRQAGWLAGGEQALGRQAGEGRAKVLPVTARTSWLARAGGMVGWMDLMTDETDGRGAAGGGSGGERNRVCAARERRRGGIMK